MILTCWDSTKEEEYSISLHIGGAFVGHKIVRAEFTDRDFAELRNLSASPSQDAKLAAWFRHMAIRNDVARISKGP